MNIRSRLFNKSGSALLTVLLVVLISTILVASFFVMSSQRSFMANKLTNRTRALSIAEAGVHVAYSILETNFEASASDTAFPATAYGGGQFDVTVTPLSNNVAVIKSEGTFGEVTETVILDVTKYGEVIAGENNGGGVNPVGDIALYANGEITVNGSCWIEGNCHANQKMRFNGSHTWGEGTQTMHHTSAVQITGRGWLAGGPGWNRVLLEAPDVDATPWPPYVTIKENPVAIIAVPELELMEYYNIAEANGQVKPGGNYIHFDWSDVPGGVLWFNGDIMIQNTGNDYGFINALVIATGNITLRNGFRMWDAPSGAVGIISRDGSITVTGNPGVQAMGLLFARNDITIDGAIHFNSGQMIAGGDITINGSFRLDNAEMSDIGMVGEDSVAAEAGYKLRPTAWQK